MTEDKPVHEESLEKRLATPRRESRSVFAPIVLIAAGVFFLLDNIGVVAGLDWQAVVRFWPLALIFLGLNVLVVQMRPPLGTLLSAIVALAAVGVFGYLLFSGTPIAALRSIGVAENTEVREETFNITPGVAQTAEITIHLGNYPATVADAEGPDLIAGSIWTRTGLDMSTGNEGDDHIKVEVGELPSGLTLDFGDWVGEDHTWEFFLNPDMPIDLTIDGGNSSMEVDLAALRLTDLFIDGSNGRTRATLPAGAYDFRLDGGNGGIDVTLPGEGELEVRVDSGNGGIEFALPRSMAARVEYDTGNGDVRVGDRFERIEGDRDEGVYVTEGYDGASDRVLFIIETGNGPVRISD